MNTSLQGPRYSPITGDDHAGIVWIIALLSLVFYVLTLATRIYVKRHKWWWDDTICAVATVAGVASFVSLAVGLNHGLGKRSSLVTDDQLKTIGQVRKSQWSVGMILMG